MLFDPSWISVFDAPGSDSQEVQIQDGTGAGRFIGTSNANCLGRGEIKTSIPFQFFCVREGLVPGFSGKPWRSWERTRTFGHLRGPCERCRSQRRPRQLIPRRPRRMRRPWRPRRPRLCSRTQCQCSLADDMLTNVTTLEAFRDRLFACEPGASKGPEANLPLPPPLPLPECSM